MSRTHAVHFISFHFILFPAAPGRSTPPRPPALPSVFACELCVFWRALPCVTGQQARGQPAGSQQVPLRQAATAVAAQTEASGFCTCRPASFEPRANDRSELRRPGYPSTSRRAAAPACTMLPLYALLVSVTRPLLITTSIFFDRTLTVHCAHTSSPRS